MFAFDVSGSDTSVLATRLAAKSICLCGVEC